MLDSVTSSGDHELDMGLRNATKKEVHKGSLIGPIPVSNLPPGATLTRRFAVRQKNKIRPIDDYRASMVNASVKQSESVSVHSIDHIAAMISLWIRLGTESGRTPDLVAKCWDLTDAYKQVPLSDHAFQNDASWLYMIRRAENPWCSNRKFFHSVQWLLSLLSSEFHYAYGR